MGGPACITKTIKSSYAARATKGFSNVITSISTPQIEKILKFY